MSDTLPCKHSTLEIYEDTKKKGYYFAECVVCESQGGLDTDPKKAREKLLKVKANRPNRQGGIRVGAGRPKVLDDSAKPRAFVLEDSHIDKIDRFMDQHKKSRGEELAGRSLGLRTLLDSIRLKDMKELCTR